MYNKKVLSTALKNLNKTNGPVKKKDSLYPMDNNYQFNDNMPMMKEGGSKNFVNSKDHGVDTPVYIKTEEKSSPIHGTGVFTKQPVTKGQIIGVSHIRKEFERDGQMYQAPFPSKTIGGYNHSESPNVTEVDNGDHIVMLALKDIQPGEELVSNYYESNIDDLEKPEDFKNELTKANGGLQVAKGIASELGLISKTAPFINEWGNLIKKGSSLAIPELNQVIRNLSQVSPQIGVEFPSVYFHGTNSSILPGLLKNSGLTNQGDLSKLGITSFAGENMFGSQGINQQALSTVSADNIDEALKYSLFNLQGNPLDDFAKWWGEQRLGYTKDYSPKGMLPAPEFYDQLYNSRLDAYNNLSNEEKILTENKFPLLFGIHPKYGDNSRFVIPRSDISGETGIRGNINFDEISNIFVPSSKVGQVQSFLKPYYNFNISEIEPFLENTNWRNKDLLDRYKKYGFKKGGSTKRLKRNKRGSKSLLATNKLFAPNKLFKKPRKGKIYNPNADSFRYGGPIVKQRRGVRKNPDGSESTHLMRTEYIPERGWVGFPSLFQDSKPYADDQQNWVDMSEEEDWMKIYEEAERRGEVYDFGEDKEAALAFGMSSWEDEAIQSPEAWVQEIRRVEREIGDPRGWTMDDYNRMQDKLNKYKAWRQRHPEVIDHSNEPNEYVVPLPPHLNADQYIEAKLTDDEIEKYVKGGYIVEELPKANKGLQILKGMTKSAKPMVNTFNTFKGLTNMAPKLADLSRVNYINSVYPGTLELISDLKNSNIISPTLNETVLAMNPNLLNLVTKRGIQDALTFTRSTTPSVLEGLSSSGTRTPISNLDMGNFIKYGLVGDDPGLAMYTASHVPGMRYGKRDGLSRLPYKTTLVGNAKQGTPESLDALYTFPQISGIPRQVQQGMFGDTYGSYASILRYPFDYSGSASDMFDRYKTFENTVFDKGRTLRKYSGSKDAEAGDIGALNFVNEPTLDNIFYQSIFSHAPEVPFIGNPGQKVLEPVATYTKPIVQEIKAERNRIGNLYNEGKYEEMINELNKKVKAGDFGSPEANIKSMEIDPEFAKFDLSKYNLPESSNPHSYLLDAFDPKTGLIKTKGDLKSIANKALHSYWNFVEDGPLMDAFRDPTNVLKYNYSPLKYKFKKGGELPKADRGIITQTPKLLGLKSSGNILDDLLVRTRNLWQTPQGISRLNEMIVNTPALSSLNVTPEIMINDLSNITNLNYIFNDALKQQKILQENQNVLRDKLNKLRENNASEWEINKQIAAKRRNKYELFNIDKKIENLYEYYTGAGKYTEPRLSMESKKTNPFPHSINLDSRRITAADAPMIGMHEIGHFPGMYYGKLSLGPETYHTYLDDMLSGLKLKSDSELMSKIVDYGSPLKYNMGNLLTGEARNPLIDKFGNKIPDQFEHPFISAKNYFVNKKEERSPFMNEVREKMLQDSFIKHPYELMTPNKFKTYYDRYMGLKDEKFPLRYLDIIEPTEKTFKTSSNVFNRLLTTLPGVMGAGALGSSLDEKAVGGPMLGDPPVVEDPLRITPDSELDDAQKYIRNWFRNRVLPETDDKFYNRIMSKSLDKAKERVNTFPDYTPLVTDDPTARGIYIGGESPEIQVVPGLSPEEDLTTKVHELTTYVNDPLSDNLQYQDIYGNIIKKNVKSFKEGWGDLTGADKKAAKQFYDYVTDPSEDNIHSYMMNARRIFNVSPDQVVTEADIENWKKTAEDEGMLDRNSENYNDELYILFKLAKDNKSMTNLFNYLAMDESPQMEGDMQMAKMGGVISLGDEVDEATMKKLKAQGYTFEEI